MKKIVAYRGLLALPFGSPWLAVWAILIDLHSCEPNLKSLKKNILFHDIGSPVQRGYVVNELFDLIDQFFHENISPADNFFSVPEAVKARNISGETLLDYTFRHVATWMAVVSERHYERLLQLIEQLLMANIPLTRIEARDFGAFLWMETRIRRNLLLTKTLYQQGCHLSSEITLAYYTAVFFYEKPSTCWQDPDRVSYEASCHLFNLDPRKADPFIPNETQLVIWFKKSAYDQAQYYIKNQHDIFLLVEAAYAKNMPNFVTLGLEQLADKGVMNVHGQTVLDIVLASAPQHQSLNKKLLRACIMHAVPILTTAPEKFVNEASQFLAGNHRDRQKQEPANETLLFWTALLGYCSVCPGLITAMILNIKSLSVARLFRQALQACQLTLAVERQWLFSLKGPTEDYIHIHQNSFGLSFSVTKESDCIWEPLPERGPRVFACDRMTVAAEYASAGTVDFSEFLTVYSPKMAAIYAKNVARAVVFYRFWLSQESVNLDERNAIGETPLLYVAKSGGVDRLYAALALIACGAQPKVRNHQGQNLLHYVARGSSENFNLILQRYPELALEHDQSGRTPIEYVEHLSSSTVQLLLERVEPLPVDIIFLCLLSGIQYEDLDLIAALGTRIRGMITRPTGQSLSIYSGETPLHMVKSERVLRQLLLQDADFFLSHASDAQDQTLWHRWGYDSRIGVADFRAMLKLLEPYGVDFNQKNHYGEPVLFALLSQFDALSLKKCLVLLELGVDPHVMNVSGQTLWHILAQKTASWVPEAEPVYQAILASGVNLDQLDNAQKKPLDYWRPISRQGVYFSRPISFSATLESCLSKILEQKGPEYPMNDWANLFYQKTTELTLFQRQQLFEVAACTQDLSLGQRLVAKANKADFSYQTAFIYACQQKDLAFAKWLQEIAPVDIRLGWGVALITLRRDLLDWLLTMPVPLDFQDAEGNTLWHWTAFLSAYCSPGYIHFGSLLRGKGVDFDVQSQEGKTALMIIYEARTRDHCVFDKWVLNFFSSIKKVEAYPFNFRCNWLWAAVRHGSTELALWALVRLRKHSEFKNVCHDIACYAFRENQVPILELLLAQKAVELTGYCAKEGVSETPTLSLLEYALEKSAAKTIEALLDDVETPSWRAIEIAAAKGYASIVQQLWMKYPLAEREPNRLLALGVEQNSPEVVEQAMALGADVNVRQKAVGSCYSESCSFLTSILEKLNSVSSKPSEKLLAEKILLHFLDSPKLMVELIDGLQAIQRIEQAKLSLRILQRIPAFSPTWMWFSQCIHFRRFELFQLLSEQASDFSWDTPGENGMTLLHLSVSKKSPDFFNFLRQKGAKIEAITFAGESCAHFALYSGNLERFALSPPLGLDRALYEKVLQVLTLRVEFRGEYFQQSLRYCCYKLARLFGCLEWIHQYINEFSDRLSRRPIYELCLFELPAEDERWTACAWALLCLKDQTVTQYLALAPLIERVLGRAPTTLAEIQKAALQITYARGSENPEAAAGFLRYSISERIFDFFLDHFKPKIKEDIPAMWIEGREAGVDPRYYSRRLSATDWRGFVLGKMTGCCQYIGGFGHCFAWEGMTSAKSGFYAIFKRPSLGTQQHIRRLIAILNQADSEEAFLRRVREKDERKKYAKRLSALQAADVLTASEALSALRTELVGILEGELVAQMWAWLSHENVLVLDSWESKRRVDDVICEPILRVMAKKILQENPLIPAVRLGMGGQTPSALNFSKVEKAISRYDFYAWDSREQYEVLKQDSGEPGRANEDSFQSQPGCELVSLPLPESFSTSTFHVVLYYRALNQLSNTRETDIGSFVARPQPGLRS